MSRLYNIFSGTNNRSGKGISKGQAAKDKKMGCSYFFYLLRTRLGKISATNLIFTLCNFTLILFLMGITGMFDPETSAPSTPLYSQIYGMETAGESSTACRTDCGSWRMYCPPTSSESISPRWPMSTASSASTRPSAAV